MDLRQLKAFIALAERLNFSRAAESLYITQPALSQQIAELESLVGCRLFTRTSRSVRLTDSGAAPWRRPWTGFRSWPGARRTIPSSRKNSAWGWTKG